MLPAPNLDDRRFQDLVDDAKRLVQRRCPEWSDHNVSDPGVTLIETFAYMVDQLLYRLNRVPDRHHVAFLELLGLHLHPPTSAKTPVTFWLSAPQEETVIVRAGTEVATPRTETDDAVVFQTADELVVPSVHRSRVRVRAAGSDIDHDHTDSLDLGGRFSCFSAPPVPGDALYIGLSRPAPRCAIALRFDCEIEGVGVDPDNPPLRWEAQTAAGWEACDVDHDDTGGLNRAGDVVLHLPRAHIASTMAAHRAGWLRATVVEPDTGQPTYSESPQIGAIAAVAIGGTVDASHGELVFDEVVGLSEGVPGQRFRLEHAPIVGADPVVVEVAGGDGWQEWRCVDNFSASSPTDRHFLLDRLVGELQLGPAVREPDGTLTQYGAVPPKATPIRVRSYRHGGGRAGNVSRGAVSILKETLANVAKVENRQPALGGVDAESLEQARDRAPIELRTRDRAVTAEDYEHLARQAAPHVGRVRCSTADDGTDAGVARVLIVPAIGDDDRGAVSFEKLAPNADLLERIASFLDARRTIGARVVVEPPPYKGITVVARLRAQTRSSMELVRASALEALYLYFHPLRGGPDGDGWPFGRPVHVGEVYAALQGVRGVEFVEEARLFEADPITGERGDPVDRIDLSANALVFSFNHQIRVQQ